MSFIRINIGSSPLRKAAALLVFACTEQLACASLVLEASGPADFDSSSSGTMSVDYNVVYDTSDSLYTYLYSFTPNAGSPISTFTVEASYVSSVFTTADAISGTPCTITGPITADGTFDASMDEVSWTFDPATSAEQTIGFSSFIGPGAGTGSLTDDDTGPWSSPDRSPIPAPAVPEMPTLISGALLMLPLGVGILRSVRKNHSFLRRD
jgi:hypothetical protein